MPSDLAEVLITMAVARALVMRSFEHIEPLSSMSRPTERLIGQSEAGVVEDASVSPVQGVLIQSLADQKTGLLAALPLIRSAVLTLRCRRFESIKRSGATRL